jgi:hypothetical protein
MDWPSRVHFLASATSTSDPLNFFLWGFMKDEVYILPMSTTQNNLKDQIQTAIAKTD